LAAGAIKLPINSIFTKIDFAKKGKGSGRPDPLTPANLAELFGGNRGRQHVILELVAQHSLLDFAGRRVRDGADEHDVVG
jgi:hypothetical protein